MSDDVNTPRKELTGRTFLCVVDQTEEFAAALQFACKRAVNSGGRVALVYVIEPAEFQHWMAVGERMREEAREEAEETLNVVASVVQKRTENMPVLYIREGTNVREEVVQLIEEEESISLLVLGASTGTDGPGPLITYLVEKMAGKLRVPVTIVPGSLSEEDIDQIT